MPKAWLANYPWASVIALNEQLCAAKNALHKPTSDGYEPAKESWESRYAQSMGLDEAVELCRQCHKLAPFCFFNGNSFAAIVRSAIGLTQGLSAGDSYVLRNIVGHIVAGTSTPEEDIQFKKLLEKVT